MTTLLRFNLGLLPASTPLADALTELARDNYGAHEKDYCLGPESLPHITLCQFSADEPLAGELWREASIMLPEMVPVHFTHLYLQPGIHEHAGYLWSGLAVQEGGLPLLHRQVHQQVMARDLEAHTAAAWFFPHVTWARVKTAPAVTRWPEKHIWQETHEFTPALGLSDDNGAWLKTLYCLSLA